MIINIIAAQSANGVIGAGGKIPWDLPEDRAFFKRLTTGNIIIMGRKTFESIGSPLPGRYNIVLSKTKNYSGDDLITVPSLEAAFKAAEEYNSSHGGDKQVFICGGEEVYRQSLGSADRIYLTQLTEEYEGDAFFPDISVYGGKRDFMLVYKEMHSSGKFSVCLYEKTLPL